MPLDDAAAIVRRLREAGHEAFLVGGCVRDLIRGVTPKDFDIVTSARPEEVQASFCPDGSRRRPFRRRSRHRGGTPLRGGHLPDGNRL